MCIRDRPETSQCSKVSQERVKLRISNLAVTFTGSIRTKAHWKFGRKGSVGVSRNCLKFLSEPLISQERVKLRTSNMACTFIKIVQKMEHGRNQGLPKILKYPEPIWARESKTQPSRSSILATDFSGEQKEVWTMAVLCKQTAIQILSR